MTARKSNTRYRRGFLPSKKLLPSIASWLVVAPLLSLVALTTTAESANAAAGSISNGSCASTVGETTTASIVQSGNVDCIVTFTSGTNSWTVPAGVTTARILVVGGGAGGDRGVCSVYWGHGGGGGEEIGRAHV